MAYGITQYYLPPGRGDIPAFTPAEAGTRLSDPEGMQGWVDLGKFRLYEAVKYDFTADLTGTGNRPEEGTE